jgi:hypothetical protein
VIRKKFGKEISHLKQHTAIWLKNKKREEQAVINKIDEELAALLRLQLQNHASSNINCRIRELEKARLPSCVKMRRGGA